VAFAPAIQDTWQETVNPPLKVMHNGGFPAVVVAKGGCPGPAGKFDPSVPRPCAEAINISHSSTWVVNYRNEPVGLRVFDPDGKGPDGQNGTQAAGLAGDLAFALQSRGDREIPQLNTSFGDTPYPTNPGYCQGSNGDLINCDRKPGDPFTPIMRAFENDEVKIKIQVGATEEQHQATVHGVKWLSNGSAFGRSPNSGWRNFQSHGISEQFSLQVPMTSDPQQIGQEVDYFYATDATREGMWLGTWGILRSYGQNRSDLFELPDNPQQGSVQFVNGSDFNGVCPTSATVVPFDVVAVLANEALPNAIDVDGTDGPDITINPNTQIIDQDTGMVLGGDSDGDGVGDNVGGPLDPNGGTLVYNRRGTVVLGIDSCTVEVEEGQSCEEAGGEIIPGVDRAGPLNDPTAMMYVRLEDLVPGKAVIDTVGNMEIGQDEDGNTVYGVGQDGIDDRCQEAIAVIDPADPAYDPTNPPYDINLTLAGCPVKVAATAPVEPLVLRANAGQCLEVTLHNKLIDQAQAANKPVYSCENDGSDGCLDNTYEPLFEAEEAQTADYDPGLLLADAYGAPVALDDVVFDQVPDLAGWQDLMWGVTRRIQPGDVAGPLRNPNANDQMYFFNNNLIRPSGYVGLYSQLVASDTSRDNGVLVGNNSQQTLAAPGGQTTYRWYAGDLKQVAASRRGGNQRRFEIVATPIEFGGSNLLSADRIKQPQKGLFGALSILPEGTTDVDVSTLVPDGQGSGSATRGTRAQATITSPSGVAESGGVFRENLLIGHKLGNLRWADGSAIQNYEQSDLGVEGAEDSGHAGFNYGMEPSWFRFKLDPDAPAGNAGEPNSYGSIPNPQAFYANKLVETELNSIPAITTIDGVQVSKAGDPQTPVFRASASQKTRIHVLNGASADRDGTFILHGHLWQRDPFVCTSSMYSTNGYLGDPEDATVSLEGRCTPKVMHDDPGVASSALGLNPQGKWMGGEEGMGHVYGHWPILFDAGGTGQVQGDYLYRDYAPNGNRNGQFGILRVGEAAVVEDPPADGGGKGGGKGKKK
jgi:hypothetical protein